MQRSKEFAIEIKRLPPTADAAMLTNMFQSFGPIVRKTLSESSAYVCFFFCVCFVANVSTNVFDLVFV